MAAPSEPPHSEPPHSEPVVIPLDAGPLTTAAWAPFGWLPVDDVDPVDATLHYEFAWGDAHVNFIAHSFDEVEHPAPDVALCDVMYRHATHTQTLMPLNRPSIVAVAPPHTDFVAPGAVDSVRAFLLQPLDALTLFRGTWHWGPFPISADAPVRLFNVQGKRYAADNEDADLRGLGLRFAVRVGNGADAGEGS